jgi:hypothetical protein
VIKVESRGSMWLIDHDLGRYLRMPKEEVPRNPEWSLGTLEDLVWHDYESWWISYESFGAKDATGTLFLYAPPTLVIRPSGSPRKVCAPDAYIVSHDVTAGG